MLIRHIGRLVIVDFSQRTSLDHWGPSPVQVLVQFWSQGCFSYIICRSKIHRQWILISLLFVRGIGLHVEEPWEETLRGKVKWMMSTKYKIYQEVTKIEWIGHFIKRPVPPAEYSQLFRQHKIRPPYKVVPDLLLYLNISMHLHIVNRCSVISVDTLSKWQNASSFIEAHTDYLFPRIVN